MVSYARLKDIVRTLTEFFCICIFAYQKTKKAYIAIRHSFLSPINLPSITEFW